ncbi:melanoma inhibitory activity protein 2 [Xyrichtys novacula]|uniref:Melanoma inhibitory activity protein 2 n=1 Tax=Xyrichtys novacula TaxID=13765 RepID=A0AAV1GNQ6_XYRNO|nr:melanoma inhibitory activity protein 2 [Xyrichtys novacula]
MSVSQAYKLLWSIGLAAVLFPHLHTGLLSDYKICGDPECQSLMSRVQAIRDHHGKDCRFLNFRRGDTIFVYHKLTGKRDDLWAGSIDKQFGHFPKDAVKEEHFYATVERVVETQNSDFFCMDEFGYPIDSSELDSDDDEDGVRIEKQDPDTTQPTHPDNDAESPSTSGSISAESQGSTDATQTELDKNTNTDVDAVETPHETQEDPLVSEEQGGSASSAWFGSTVTGLLGLAKEEESANLAEGEEKDEREETQDEASSFTASVTGWLGMGGSGGKTDDEVKSEEEEDREDAESFTSTMTGWIGFGGEKKPEKSAEKEDDKERPKHEEQEPTETFRSRRMSLDLEGSQLQEEERTEMGTLDWLGNGLSSTLGFGRTNQEPERKVEEIVKEEASGSWYDMGIGSILGYGNDKTDESIPSGFQEAEVDETSDQPTGSESADTGQLQAEQTEGSTTETTYESIIETPPQEGNISTEAETVSSTAELINIDAPDSSKDGDLSENTAAESEGGKSSAIDIFFQTSKEDNKDNILGEKAADVRGEVHQTSEATENRGDDYNRQTKEEIKAAEKSDQEMLTRTDIDLSSDSSSVDFKSDTASQSVGGDKSENVVLEGAQIQSHIDESADEISMRGNDHEADMNNQGSGVLQREISEIETEGAVEQSDIRAGKGSILSHDPSSSEQETLLQIGGKADPVFLSPDEQQIDNQSDEDAQEQREAVQNSEKDVENFLEPAQIDTTGIEQYNVDDSGLTTSVGSETETEEESKEEKKEREMEENRVEEQEEMQTQVTQKQMDEEKQDEVKELEEKQQGVKEVKEKEELVELEELKEKMTQEEAEEITEKERWHELEELKKEETQMEEEEIQEREKLVELKELKEEEIKKDDDDEEEMGWSKEVKTSVDEEVRQSWMEELKEDENFTQVEENQQYIGESEEDKQDIVEDLEERGRIEELTEDGKDKKDDKEAEHVEQEKENVERVESANKELESQGEKSLETPEPTEGGQIEGAEKEEESKETEKMGEVEDAEETVKDEGKDGIEEGQDTLVRDSDEKDSMDEEMTEAGKTNPTADMTEESRITSFEGIKRDEDSVPRKGGNEEERNDVVEANERQMENLDVRIYYTNTVSDLHSLEVDQTEKTEHMNSDLPHSVEDVQDSLSKDVSTGVTDTSQLYSSEVENTELTDDKVIYKWDKTDVENTETSSKKVSSEEETKQTISDHKGEERMLNMMHNDGRVNEEKTFGTEVKTEGNDFQSETFESLVVVSEQTFSHHPAGSSLPSYVPDDEKAENKNGGAFDLFKNAFSYFGQTPATEPETSTQSSQSLDSNTPETPEVQTFHTLEQLQDTTSHSSQVYSQDLHLDTSNPLSEQLQPSPSPAQAPDPHPSTVSPNTESPPLMKTVFKHLHTTLSADDTVMLVALLGQHKLQFLDDILESSETMTGDPNTDESILLDVERLLHYHREMLVAPRGKLLDAPQEDKEKTKTLIALEKLEMLLKRVRMSFNTGKPDSSNTNHQADGSCDGESCSNLKEDKKMTAEEERHKEVDSPVGTETNTAKGEWMGLDEDKDGKLRGDTEEQRFTHHKEENASPVASRHSEPRTSQTLEGQVQQLLGFLNTITGDSSAHIQAARELLIWLTVQVVSALPDDIRPGPDLYGVPWEPVIVSGLVGLVTVLLFICRCYSSVKSRLYRSKEQWMAEQVAQLLDEKCKVLETLSQCQQEYDDLETSLRDSGVLAHSQKTEQLEVKARQLGHSKKEMEKDLKQLKSQLDEQREHREEQEKRIAVLEESMKTFEEETKDLQSQEEQAQTTLKVYNMNSERLQRNLETAGEENKLLQESNAQFRQQVEGWAERVSELEAEISRCEIAHSGMQQDVANKDERIWSLTDRLLRMKAWDSDLQEERGQEEGETDTSNGTTRIEEENKRGDRMDTQSQLQKAQKLIYAAKLNADLKSVDEDKDRVFAKLNDEIKAKEDLQVSIKELESEKLLLQSDSEHYTDQVQRLQQKLHIMTEMYQENELKLHRLLTVEEKERMQKEERLNKADKNIALAMEELNNYRQRAGEMEEELEKTKQSYQTQISAHEKKAHNNWLAARAAERDLSDIRRENALFRQKLTDTQFKLDALDKDPYALNSLARPQPFRAERSPYGPSPLGRPSSETRAFLSPPTLMDGPPTRLSPRVPRGPMEPLGGPGEMERTGGPHSDSGSISPTWERDRRGPPPGPPGPPGPQGGPIYRRPLPPPGAMGPFPPPGPFPPRGLPPGPFHPADMTDASLRENSFGPGEQELRESGPGDQRSPPEADPRMGGPPPPGPPLGPMDGPFPRRAPYGPPPPDFYPPRGPGVPPMRPMWAAPPPGMMLPPRYPPAGPPLPHQAPPMRHPFHEGLPPPSMGPLPPRQPLPSPPHSQSPEEHTPSPEDAI